jgi:hypothetical protein
MLFNKTQQIMLKVFPKFINVSITCSSTFLPILEPKEIEKSYSCVSNISFIFCAEETQSVAVKEYNNRKFCGNHEEKCTESRSHIALRQAEGMSL